MSEVDLQRLSTFVEINVCGGQPVEETEPTGIQGPSHTIRPAEGSKCFTTTRIRCSPVPLVHRLFHLVAGVDPPKMVQSEGIAAAGCAPATNAAVAATETRHADRTRFLAFTRSPYGQEVETYQGERLACRER